MQTIKRRDLLVGLGVAGLIPACTRDEGAIGPLLPPADLAARIEDVKRGKIAELPFQRHSDSHALLELVWRIVHMRKLAALAVFAVLVAPSAGAQDAKQPSARAGALLESGYEIKSAWEGQFLLQKGANVYLCARTEADLATAHEAELREIEKRTGVDIPFIFEKEGEAGFRARESEVLDELTQMPGVVLATGGGAIIRPENRRWLSGRGTVVYLRTSVEQQLRRTRHGHHRPLLNHPDPEGRLRELMGQRAALYEEIAAVTVNTDERKAQAVAQEIQRAIRTIASTGSARP